jgi:hypothetical protein
MNLISKTQAIKTARRAVSICGRGNSWRIYGPYRVNDLTGPSTERSADSYWSALRKRRLWVAEIAAELMGLDSYYAAQTISYTGEPTVEQMVQYCADRCAKD